MASPVKLYQREMHDNIGFFATWFPGDRLEVGDVGVLEGGRFRRMASLAELNIACAVDAGGPQQDVRYTSTTGTKLTPSAGADVAGLSGDVHTRVLEVRCIRVPRVGPARTGHGEPAVRRRTACERVPDERRWNEEWLLVDAIHVAERATIVVSQDRSAALTLAAEVAGGPARDLARGPTSASRPSRPRGAMVQIIGETVCTRSTRVCT